jgi:hypothetical protein
VAVRGGTHDDFVTLTVPLRNSAATPERVCIVQFRGTMNVSGIATIPFEPARL